jgi:tetratricopeptide (TPR) repeat protein
MVRRSCFDAVGLFDENLLAAEDWDMWIRLAKKFEFDYIDEPLYQYRIHEKRLSMNPYAKVQAARSMFEKFWPDLTVSENRTEALKCWHYRLGKLYFEIGDIRRGRKEFTRAININPHFVSCYLRLLASFFGTKVYSTSLELLNSAMPYSIRLRIAGEW